MIAGGLQGYLITKSFADEHGITHLDQLNDDPAILAAYDAGDQNPGDGIAQIYGCADSWTCGNIIDSQIAFSGWENIAQVKADYDAMFVEAVAKADAGEPAVVYTWAPSAYIAQLRPGDKRLLVGRQRGDRRLQPDRHRGAARATTSGPGKPTLEPTPAPLPRTQAHASWRGSWPTSRSRPTPIG